MDTESITPEERTKGRDRYRGDNHGGDGVQVRDRYRGDNQGGDGVQVRDRYRGDNQGGDGVQVSVMRRWWRLTMVTGVWDNQQPDDLEAGEGV
jgi:hypothetical protein